MAEAGRYVPPQCKDLGEILQEAQHRWLRPTEICEILRNYQKFPLASDPPVRPPAGSLFLFDRKALRYFRKDGHQWRKKKDGKTVKEAHEKLKAGSVEVLHCYYAHGEENENFQRRSYWMLDGQLEHIVLVHYREVKEDFKSAISCLLPHAGFEANSCQNSLASVSGHEISPFNGVEILNKPKTSSIDWNGGRFSSELKKVDCIGGFNPGSSSLNEPELGLNKNFATLALPHGVSEFPATTYVDSVHQQEQPSGADKITQKLTDPRLDTGGSIHEVVICGDRLHNNVDVPEATPGSCKVVQDSSDYHTVINPNDPTEKQAKGSEKPSATRELKKLDSFGRWMDKEIGGDGGDSLMSSDCGNYWSTIDAENNEREVSSLSRNMQLDIDSMGPSLSQEQLFSIWDFSPEWAYSGSETKVLIVGSFLGSKKLSKDTNWGCMFGEIEVSAEVLTDNVIRCQAPFHAPGVVPFYVTCSNRLACSEVREFEYLEKPAIMTSSSAQKISPEEEMRFRIRLTRLLHIGPDERLDCSTQECEKCKIKNCIKLCRSDTEKDWGTIAGIPRTKSICADTKEGLIQYLLKDRLFEWLIHEVHEGGRGLRLLDNEGQGVIHLAAALGYEWAMSAIVASGVSPNFRDTRGRTALHWASHYGREETVVALIQLGAAPGAVEDPTPAFPGGLTAADLASNAGHKGLAGYLAEADLAAHLSTLALDKVVTDNVSVTHAAEEPMQIAEQVIPSDVATDEHLSMRGPLAAIRKSTHAAALIHSAFRARSFQQRQLTERGNEISNVSVDLVELGALNKVEKIGRHKDYLHMAAVRIQQKYRGWKRRKEFLKIRNRIVKIQAHVRGHQVRKQYKKVVWSVSIMEKAILRWRRKGVGLRGFRLEKANGTGEAEAEKTDEYEFLRIGRKMKYAGVENALARVKSMARHPEARDQYMRLIAKSENSKDN